MARSIDITKTYGEIVAQEPGVEAVLKELGFEELPEDKTIGEIAEAAGVSPAIVAMGLEASDYAVEGYEADEESKAAGKTLDDVLGAVFANEIDGVKLPDDASSSPMFAHMEMAIRRAQRDGKLPETDGGQDGGQA